jgi:osmotically-inducible protein OsmY
MKKLATLIALAALAAGCSATDNANTGANGNKAVVVNNNANLAANTSTANANTANANRRTYNANISEADYEREKARYGTEAKEAGDSVGSGLKDGYLHVKTKGALFAVDDLRDSTINVDVDNGVITLRGTVANAAQKAAAMKAANGIDGKKSVVDKLTLRAEGAATNDNKAHNANAKH